MTPSTSRRKRTRPPVGLLRQLARHQWVRLHGTPRVTVLGGDAEVSEVWRSWLVAAGLDAELLEAESIEQLDQVMRHAMARAMDAPAAPIAVRAPLEMITAWQRQRRDRLRALAEEGIVAFDLEEVDAAPAPGAPADAASTTAPGARPPTAPGVSSPTAPGAAPQGARPRERADELTLPIAARSAAEAALFEALEATPATTGRFELNGRLAVRFGSTAAEVDLLSRRDLIAIELDGARHFDDLDRYRRDRRKDLLLQTQGLLVIRLLAEDVLRDARDSVRAVCEALAYRRGTPPAGANPDPETEP
ncbi:MAG: DUF559 domain-containing protein [Kofleriaceae bacterium]